MSLLEVRNYYLALAYFAETFRADIGGPPVTMPVERGQDDSGLAEPPAACSVVPGTSEDRWTS